MAVPGQDKGVVIGPFPLINFILYIHAKMKNIFLVLGSATTIFTSVSSAENSPFKIGEIL